MGEALIIFTVFSVVYIILMIVTTLICNHFKGKL